MKESLNKIIIPLLSAIIAGVTVFLIQDWVNNREKNEIILQENNALAAQLKEEIALRVVAGYSFLSKECLPKEQRINYFYWLLVDYKKVEDYPISHYFIRKFREQPLLELIHLYRDAKKYPLRSEDYRLLSHAGFAAFSFAKTPPITLKINYGNEYDVEVAKDIINIKRTLKKNFQYFVPFWTIEEKSTLSNELSILDDIGERDYPWYGVCSKNVKATSNIIN